MALRLTAARETIGMSQVEFARAIGANPTTYPAWEFGRSLPKVNAIANLHNVGISAEWVLTGEGCALLADRLGPPMTGVAERDHVQTDRSADFIFVPRYDIKASAGAGSVVYSEGIVDHLAFKASWIRDIGLSPSDLLLIEASGDSMEPTISSGDLLLIDVRRQTFRDSAVYVINIDGDLLVKRVERRLSGGVVVKSDNQRYESEAFSADQAADIRVVGQVIWQGHML